MTRLFCLAVELYIIQKCYVVPIGSIVSTNDSSVLASRTLTLSPSALLPLTRLQSLQGGANTPLAYKILCVRFTSVVHVCYSLLTIGNAIRQRRNTRYGWVISPYERSS